MNYISRSIMIPVTAAFCIVLLQALACERPRTFPEKPAARLGKGTITQIAYSPDGKLLAVAGSIGAWLYDAGAMNEVGLLEGHTGWVRCIAFSPDGRLLALGSAMGQFASGTLTDWSVWLC